MSAKAVVPGSFDPITNGHLDVIERAVKLFDEVIILVGDNPHKKETFSSQERMAMIKESISHLDKVKVEHHDGLLLDYVKKNDIKVMVRGLRMVSDFETEFQRALLNRELDESVETVFVMTKDKYSFLKSSIIKEIALFGGDISQFVPRHVAEKVKEKVD